MNSVVLGLSPVAVIIVEVISRHTLLDLTDLIAIS